MRTTARRFLGASVERCTELERREDITLEIDIVVDVGLAGGEIVGGQQQRPQCPRVLEHEGEGRVDRAPLGSGPRSYPRDGSSGHGGELVGDGARSCQGIHRHHDTRPAPTSRRYPLTSRSEANSSMTWSGRSTIRR